MSTTNKVVIITGAGKGVGKALAIGLSRSGFDVVATTRNTAEIQQFSKRLEGNFSVLECDISKWGSCRKLIGQVIKKCGKIDVLINNASGWVDKSLLKATKEDIDSLIDTTTKGTAYITKLCLQQMVKKKSGHIFSLLTSSYRHGIGSYNNKVLTPYYTAKFGTSGMSEALKHEASKHNVKVTSVYLGSIASDLDIDDAEEKLHKKHGIKRVHVKSVVESVIFIANQPRNTMIDEVIISSLGDF